MTTLTSPKVHNNVEQAYALQSSIRSVITFMITDAFSLTEEESMWTSHHILRIIEPLVDSPVKSIAVPVKKEYKTGIYSKMLTERDWSHSGVIAESGNQQASLQDWARVVSNVIFECYQPRPIYETSIVGQITGVLVELGVGHPQNPRKSLYLPNALRYQLNKK